MMLTCIEVQRAPLRPRAISAFTRVLDALWRVVGRGRRWGDSNGIKRPPPRLAFRFALRSPTLPTASRGEGKGVLPAASAP
jgi:hypothetical protein